MAYRVDYTLVNEVSQRVGYPHKHSENNANFDGPWRGYTPPHDSLTLASKASF